MFDANWTDAVHLAASNREKDELFFLQVPQWPICKHTVHHGIVFRFRFFGSVIMNQRNIDWLGGLYYVDLKVKGDLEFRTLRLKILLFSANGFINYSLRMEYGRKSFVISTWNPKPFLKSIGNLVTHIFGLVSWRPRNSFSNLGLSRSGTVPRFDSGKTLG